MTELVAMHAPVCTRCPESGCMHVQHLHEPDLPAHFRKLQAAKVYSEAVISTLYQANLGGHMSACP